MPLFRETAQSSGAQRTELMLGVLLGMMLIGHGPLLIRRDQVARRGGRRELVLAQLTAGAEYGHGDGRLRHEPHIVTLALPALAANTSHSADCPS